MLFGDLRIKRATPASILFISTGGHDGVEKVGLLSLVIYYLDTCNN